MDDIGELVTQGHREPGGAAARADVASAEMTQQPARVLVRREPVTCGADRPLREVARVMAEEDVNSMIVREVRGDLAIVADVELCARGVAEGLSVGAPVWAVVAEHLA